jgi:hypothetical protein
MSKTLAAAAKFRPSANFAAAWPVEIAGIFARAHTRVVP